jgi:hypothetical protein
MYKKIRDFYKRQALNERRKKDPYILYWFFNNPQDELKRVRWKIDTALEDFKSDVKKPNYYEYPEIRIQKFDPSPILYLISLGAMALFMFHDPTSLIFLSFPCGLYVLLEYSPFVDLDKKILYIGLDTMGALRLFAYHYILKRVKEKEVEGNFEMIYSRVVPPGYEIDQIWQLP